ncbi:glycoside hydrolase [Yamadazyma tenuis ATCC 10573]|uniref:glucan 1,3-beta-glucosidase n=1 Tax=Candida tenuis (strain ATCC 10573 / BCRC 21748 / CBS 615 / JCM 9827 / NBRC 10315 / NRRL Y-1498 / VKM Y-70) TaxID=590646 RepID=G3B2E4_CANTC|nr:glycoside hydrolase [Yamadazyma tenuis ATCC 10573]EGV64656.1 glycoside hydrolase [Yamadazyma tenuis ATCC 10573]
MPLDEYTLCQLLGESANSTMHEHYDTFITETDIEDIKNYGLNLVRIPVGYWAFRKFEGDPFVSGSEAYLDRAIEWCEKHGLKVQIDLHAMPGSQNGFDNSGQRTTNPIWLETPETVELSTQVLDYVMQKYGQQFRGGQQHRNPQRAVCIHHRFHDVYNSAVAHNVTAQLYFSDGFLPISEWNDFMVNTTGYQPIMDHHIYEIFTEDQIKLSIDQHVANIVNIGEQMLAEPHNSVVGEFSGALTDCTKYLNGVGMGARYDGTIGGTDAVGSCEGHENYELWPQEARENTKRYLEVQMETYASNSSGWIFWCYKTESAIEWDFRRASSVGLIGNVSLQPKVEFGNIDSGIWITVSNGGTKSIDSFTPAMRLDARL